MKGQLNLEFLSAALVYLLALGAVLTVSNQAVPELQGELDSRSLNLEARRISSQMLATPGGWSSGADWQEAEPEEITAVGLTNGTYHRISVEKINKLESFTYGSSDNLNYSVFKNVTGVNNQYAFNFTYKPAALTPREVPVSEYSNGSSSDLLAGYWRFEKGFGDALDYSGSSRDASVTGSVSRNVDGVRGTDGFEFSGGSVETSYSYSVDEVSVSAWVKPRRTVNGWIAGISNDDGEKWGMRLRSGSVELVQNTTGAPTTVYTESIPLNRWVHLVAVKNSTGHNSLYVDGVRAKKGVQTGDISFSGGFRSGNAPGRTPFYGKIDEPRIYNRSISSPEVTRMKRGTDIYSWPGGRPINLSSSISRDTELKFGEAEINGTVKRFLLSSTGDSYSGVYISDDHNFADDSLLTEGDTTTVGGHTYRVEGIDPEGEAVVLARHLKRFGPPPDSASDVIKLDRYALYRDDVMRMEVFAW